MLFTGVRWYGGTGVAGTGTQVLACSGGGGGGGG